MRAVSITNRGGRENNEDFVQSAHSGDIWCFALCDGLGGQLCGEVASESVCGSVCGAFSENPEISEESVYAYLEKAVRTLEEERDGRDDRYNMSSTAVVLVTDGRMAVWAHLGDSRLYRLSEGKIASITDDHSVAFLEYKDGFITYDDIRRSPNQNKLVKCVYDAEHFLPDVSAVTEVDAGDAFLLCTDGFWEYVDEKCIEETFADSDSPKEWLERMLEELHSNESKNNDNYSAIAVMP